MNGPQWTTCFAKGVHTYTFFYKHGPVLKSGAGHTNGQRINSSYFHQVLNSLCDTMNS